MSDFPDSIRLNGADYFLLQLDYMMLQSGDQGNVCTFVITLQERLKGKDLENILLTKPAYQWINSLRFRKGLPFSLSKWVVDVHAEQPKIKQYTLEAGQLLPQNHLIHAINIKTQAPFNVTLLHRSGAGSLLVFTWHHALMDAHGGESFIRYLGITQPSKQPQWLAPKHALLPLKERATIAQEMKQFLYDKSHLPLLSLYKKKVPHPTLRYKLLSFSQQQTELINKTARQQGAGFLFSTFYLAAIACAVAHIQKQRAPLKGDILVPVPLDHRPRGSHEPIVGNQVSFLFYRIPQQDLSNLKTCTVNLIEQMKSLMRAENPQHYLIMMDFLRRIPSLFYRLMLKAPTAGLMASFFYSDTGELQNHDTLFGQAIDSAVHYPPTPCPAGMTFVFSRFRGALQLTFGYMEEVISESEVNQLFEYLSASLLAE